MEAFRSRSSSRKKSGFRKSTFDQPCQIKGYLEKKSTGVMKRWQKRYFEVAGHYLKCSQDEGSINDEGSIKSAIDLGKLTKCERQGEILTLKLGSETCELQGPNDEETQLWCKVFETFLPPDKPEMTRALSQTEFYKPRALSGARKSSPAPQLEAKESKVEDFGLDTPEGRKAKRAEERARTKAAAKVKAEGRVKAVDKSLGGVVDSEEEAQADTAGGSDPVAAFAQEFTDALLKTCCNLVISKKLGDSPAPWEKILFAGLPPPPLDTEPPPPPLSLPRMTGLALAETTDLADQLFSDETHAVNEKGDFWQRRSMSTTSSAHNVKKVRMSLSARRASRYDPNVGKTVGKDDDLKMVDKTALVASAVHTESLRMVASKTAADAVSTALKSVVDSASA
jgi:hypothetical protein